MEILDDKVILEWHDIESAMRQITLFILQDCKKYDMPLQDMKVFGPIRGGLIPAVILSHKLNITLITDPGLINDKTILIDDIVDSGETVQILMMKYKSPWMVVSIAHHKNKVMTPAHWVFEKFDKWMVFPWEKKL